MRAYGYSYLREIMTYQTPSGLSRDAGREDPKPMPYSFFARNSTEDVDLRDDHDRPTWKPHSQRPVETWGPRDFVKAFSDYRVQYTATIVLGDPGWDPAALGGAFKRVLTARAPEYLDTAMRLFWTAKKAQADRRVPHTVDFTHAWKQFLAALPYMETAVDNLRRYERQRASNVSRDERGIGDGAEIARINTELAIARAEYAERTQAEASAAEEIRDRLIEELRQRQDKYITSVTRKKIETSDEGLEEEEEDLFV